MSRYAPVDENGLKPWLVTISEWGRKHDRIIYAETVASARYQAVGRMRHVSATARRATPGDLARLTIDSTSQHVDDDPERSMQEDRSDA